jgi:hypothetical protein
MDIDNDLGTEFDPAGEGVAVIDRGSPEVSTETEGRNLGESQTTTQEGDELDLSAPQFAYVDENGQEVQLTGQQIIDLLQAQQQPQAPKQEEAPKSDEPKPESLEELPYRVDPIDYAKVGPDLVSMLSGEQGGEEALGPAMAEFQFQTFIQDPRFRHVLDQAVNIIIQNREASTKETTSFQQFVGSKAEESQIKEFQKANPWAKTKEMALLGIKAANMEREIANLKTGNTDAVKKAVQEGKLTGEKQTIRNLKAKGTLRSIGNRGATAPQQGDDLKAKYDITDTDQRSRAMAEAIMRKRGISQG